MTTNVNKYRSFQYKLLNRAILTNTTLYLWNVVETPLCSFCKESEETVMHLLFLCPTILDLWTLVKRYIEHNYTCVVNLSVENVIFNKIRPEARHVANFLCLITKVYIYKCRCVKTNPNITQLSAIFTQIQSMEKYIAIRNGKLTLHEKKWGCSNE